MDEKKGIQPETKDDVKAVTSEGEVADVALNDVDGGIFSPTYDRSKPRKGTHLYDHPGE